MRRIVREAIGSKTEKYLIKKQDEIDKGKDVESTWKYARNTKSMKEVLSVLTRMAGKRRRCMYCEDSRGTTIEHYWPKSVYKEKTFKWLNLLLLCQGCQSHKGACFDLDPCGMPLLIDPTSEDPWDSLFFESHTGMVTARYMSHAKMFDRRGEHTTHEKILPLNIEAITEGRLRTKRNLHRAASAFLSDIDQGNPLREARDSLFEAIRDNDAYGLAVWYFVHDGSGEEPFRGLQLRFPGVWAAISKVLAH
jgi:uncharacterized protein (TIGR02646 family)